MKKSKITKDYQTGSIIFRVLSIMCTVVPLLVFSIIAFIKGEPQEKAVMGATNYGYHNGRGVSYI